MLKKILVSGLILSSFSSYAQWGSSASSEAMVETTAESIRVQEKTPLKWNMGLTTGVNSPNGEVKSSPEIGLYLGVHPRAQFKLGGEIITSRYEDASKRQKTTALVETAYAFGNFTKDFYNLYAGVGGGPVLSSLTTEWALVPMVGFDIPLVARANDFVSLGANAKYFFNTNAPEAFASSLAVKYWF